MAKPNALFVSFGVALAAATGCSGSSGTSAASTGGGGSGSSSGTTTGTSLPPTVPKLSPAGETANNDLMVIVVPVMGVTVCYRMDGQKPTCDMVTADCTGGSMTYSGVTQIPINGSVTNATTGAVTVEAIACLPGQTPSKADSETYILQVAAPTMSAPAGNATLAFNGAKPLDPTIATTTLSTTSSVQLWYTTGAPPAAAPTCSSGAGPIPATGTASSGQVSTASGGIQSFLTSTTFQVIACKQGYLPSAVTNFAYTIQLNPPGVLAVSSSEDGGFWPSSQKYFDYNATFQIDDTLNAGATDHLCVVVGAGPAICDGTVSDCDAGSLLTPGGTISGSFQIGNPDTFTEPLSVIACGNATLVDSAVTTGGPYSLLLDRVTSTPASGATIPDDGGALALTLEQSLPNPEDPQPATSPAYDFICWTEDGSSPSCDQDCPQSTDGSISGVLQGQQHSNGTSVKLPSSGNGALTAASFPTSVTLIALGCRNSAPPPTIDFGPSPLADVAINP